MNQIRPSTSPLIALFCLPILGALVSGVLGLSFPAGLLPVILAAAIGAWLGCRLHVAALGHQTSPESTLARPEQAAATTQPATPPAPFSATGSELTPKLRHDIRGIISPAMLAADQLDENPDPLVQKAAQTITESLERLLLRLKQQPPA